jgi:hypothetical protein
MLNDTCGCPSNPAPVNIPGPTGQAAATPQVGSAVLVGGTVTVTATLTTASKIFVERTVSGGTAGFITVTKNVAGGTFTISSSSAIDTSTFDYIIFG